MSYEEIIVPMIIEANKKSKGQAKTSTERQKASDDRHRKAGRVQRKVWATPKEHEAVKLLLEQMRFEQESLERAKAINLRTSEIDRD